MLCSQGQHTPHSPDAFLIQRHSVTFGSLPLAACLRVHILGGEQLQGVGELLFLTHHRVPLVLHHHQPVQSEPGHAGYVMS